MRKILYYAAIQMIKRNGIMYDYYIRLTNRGMLRMFPSESLPSMYLRGM